MSKSHSVQDSPTSSPSGEDACTAECRRNRPRIALLSNPKSTGNIAQLSRIRDYCAEHPDIFHYEVEHADQVGEALKTIARIRPKVLVINGGDGTVQAALTAMHNGRYFGESAPPVAVLPGGKTNLIALDLGARGDAISALEQLVELAQGDLSPHLVAREVIALEEDGSPRPVIGMFLGGAGLADTMLYCRNKICPLGLPNGLSHVLTAGAVLLRQFFHRRVGFLPPDPSPLRVSTGSNRQVQGRFALLAVTTLERLLLSAEVPTGGSGPLKLLMVEAGPRSVIRAFVAGLFGMLVKRPLQGISIQQADEISIEGKHSSVILDGETFEADEGRPIRLTPAEPLSFVRLAA
jgi:hypothetical protein